MLFLGAFQNDCTTGSHPWLCNLLYRRRKALQAEGCTLRWDCVGELFSFFFSFFFFSTVASTLHLFIHWICINRIIWDSFASRASQPARTRFVTGSRVWHVNNECASTVLQRAFGLNTKKNCFEFSHQLIRKFYSAWIFGIQLLVKHVIPVLRKNCW